MSPSSISAQTWVTFFCWGSIPVSVLSGNEPVIKRAQTIKGKCRQRGRPQYINFSTYSGCSKPRKNDLKNAVRVMNLIGRDRFAAAREHLPRNDSYKCTCFSTVTAMHSSPRHSPVAALRRAWQAQGLSRTCCRCVLRTSFQQHGQQISTRRKLYTVTAGHLAIRKEGPDRPNGCVGSRSVPVRNRAARL